MAGEIEYPTATPVLNPLNPTTTAKELEILAGHEGAAVRAAVAAHPNTPAATLGHLAAEFPTEVLGNPALPLLRLAHTRLLSTWPREGLLRLLQQEAAPAWLRRFALHSQYVEVQVALASHPALTEQELAQLAKHSAWLVRARIAARPALSREMLAQLTHDPDYGVRLALATREDLPPSSVEILRRDSSRFVRQVLEQSGAKR